MRDTKLDDLDPKFKPFAVELLARLVEEDISVFIIETKRTEEQHEEDVKNGRSWIKRSLHQDGLAIDICPLETYNLHGPDKLQWNANDPVWQKIGEIGKSLGLKWGGDWKQKDMGHFEINIIKDDANII